MTDPLVSELVEAEMEDGPKPLYSRRGKKKYIGDLNEDTFHKIISHVFEEELASDFPCILSDRIQSLRLVEQSWKRIIDRNAVLWSILSNANPPNWTQMSIKLARQAPFRLHSEQYDTHITNLRQVDTEKFVDGLIPLAARWLSLYWKAAEHTSMAILNGVAAPGLRRLALNRLDLGLNYGSLEGAFDGGTKALEILRIKGLFLSMRAPLIHSPPLRRLELVGPRPSQTRIPTHDLTDLLLGLPQLWHLKLDNIQLLGPRPPGAVNLQQLGRLELSLSGRDLASVLEAVQIHDTCEVVLMASPFVGARDRSPVPLTEVYTTLFHSLAPFIAALDPEGSGGTISIIASVPNLWLVVRNYRFTISTVSERFWFSFAHPEAITALLYLLQAHPQVFKTIPTSFLGVVDGVQQLPFREILAELPLCRQLGVMAGGYSGFGSALKTLFGRNVTPTSFAFPQVEVVEVHEDDALDQDFKRLAAEIGVDAGRPILRYIGRPTKLLDELCEHYPWIERADTLTHQQQHFDGRCLA